MPFRIIRIPFWRYALQLLLRFIIWLSCLVLRLLKILITDILIPLARAIIRQYDIFRDDNEHGYIVPYHDFHSLPREQRIPYIKRLRRRS